MVSLLWLVGGLFGAQLEARIAENGFLLSRSRLPSYLVEFTAVVSAVLVRFSQRPHEQLASPNVFAERRRVISGLMLLSTGHCACQMVRTMSQSISPSTLPICNCCSLTLRRSSPCTGAARWHLR